MDISRRRERDIYIRVLTDMLDTSLSREYLSFFSFFLPFFFTLLRFFMYLFTFARPRNEMEVSEIECVTARINIISRTIPRKFCHDIEI